MAPRKAEMVSLATLSRAVDSAVATATKRHQVALSSQTIINRWELIGRILRNAKDLNVAFEVAQDISSATSARVPGIKAQPVVSKIGGDILVGFIERGGVAKVISR